MEQAGYVIGDDGSRHINILSIAFFSSQTTRSAPTDRTGSCAPLVE
jgi:hypothetical protein